MNKAIKLTLHNEDQAREVSVHADVVKGLAVHELVYLIDGDGSRMLQLYMPPGYWSLTHVASGIAVLNKIVSKKAALRLRAALLRLDVDWTLPGAQLPSDIEQQIGPVVCEVIPAYRSAVERALASGKRLFV